MDNQEQNLPNDFFKQFKSKEDFQSFFSELYKQGVEEMLQGELDEHLGYEKHSKDGHNSGNSRNGSYTKKVKIESLGDLVLNIPRDRNSEFAPQLIPKGSRMNDKLEESIIGMYSRGMTTSDISRHVKEVYGVDVSEGTVSKKLRNQPSPFRCKEIFKKARLGVSNTFHAAFWGIGANAFW
ncbi:MAG: hypothetical protein GXC78_16705 [Chitinophagaceae bacterium]|nr:hypothetical protein [Chitinophagaceae bacterium]